MSVDKYGRWWFCATEEEGYYVAGSGDKELTNLITREQAQLIAAAPDLLDALQECLNCEFAVTDKAAINKALAAIARATEE